jgi:Rieske Fe-S protein
VLRAGAVTAAGAALLVAGGGDDTSAGVETPTAGGGGSSPAGDATEGGGSTGDPGGSLVATADVPVGGGVVLEEQKVVVTQPAAGEFKAFTAVCTHQSCTVSSVKEDRISCPCHGSSFSGTDGSVLNGPATRPLREIAVAVEGDQVVEA